MTPPPPPPPLPPGASGAASPGSPHKTRIAATTSGVGSGDVIERQLRYATAANVFLPGAGLFLLGERRAGSIVAGVFLACFVAVMAIFLTGYVNYLKMALDPEVLQGNKLERIGDGFHLAWVIAFAAAGVVIYVVATAMFIRVRARVRAASGAR